MYLFILLSSIIVFIVIKGKCYHFRLSYLFEKTNNGGITPFKAVMTSLASSMGIGNIIGISQAIMVGGPGSLFWCFLSAFFGSALKFSEGALSSFYQGGPIVYIKKSKVYFLAGIFAFMGVLASFGIGNMVQANSISNLFSFPKAITGLVLSIFVFLVIVRGLKGISNVTAKLIPFITIVFLFMSLVALTINYSKIPFVLKLIMSDAFNGKAVLGGSIFLTIKMGISRGIFSNEAGMGVSGFVHCNNKSNLKAGILASLDTIIDTMVFCMMVGLVILCSNTYHFDGRMVFDAKINSGNLCFFAYQSILGEVGGYLIFMAIIIYGFSTIITWYYYGNICYSYLFKKNAYCYLYVLFVFLGSLFSSSFVWNISDIFNYTMAFINILAIFFLLPRLINICNSKEDML